MRIAFTDTFQRDYSRLPAEIQEKVHRQIKMLSQDLRHPSLRVKKIKGSSGIWEARVDLAYRLTFVLKEEAIILRRVGPHDRTLDKP